jgi:hypothetical protein
MVSTTAGGVLTLPPAVAVTSVAVVASTPLSTDANQKADVGAITLSTMLDDSSSSSAPSNQDSGAGFPAWALGLVLAAVGLALCATAILLLVRFKAKIVKQAGKNDVSLEGPSMGQVYTTAALESMTYVTAEQLQHPIDRYDNLQVKEKRDYDELEIQNRPAYDELALTQQPATQVRSVTQYIRSAGDTTPTAIYVETPQEHS